MTSAPDLAPLPAESPNRPPLVAVPSVPGDDLETVLRRAQPRLLRYARRRLQNSHEAEECVQEALLRACQHEPGFATEDDLNAWVTVVTGRLVIDRLRVRGRSTPVAELPATARVGRDTADIVVARHEARAALDALEAMPSRQASVLWAREVEGLSYDEIAERFAITEPTVRSLLHRGRQALRREYAARGGTLPVGGLAAVLAPWRTGLHAVGRLRRVARAVAGPLPLALAGLTLGGVMLIPGHPGGSAHAALAVSPTQMRLAPTDRTNTQPGASRTQPTRADTVSFSSTTPLSRPSGPLDRVPTCGRVNGTVAGLNCGTPHPAVKITVGPPLPVVGQYWLADKGDVCGKTWVNTPVARCSTQSGAHR
ncbi:MAG TPA: RNA polymerase sigma factor [Mycobacteriales bacterium]|nr:RNA polymerase sigma factor [Mycobacteriales bacterium]